MSLRYAVGLPTVGEFGDPKLLRELSILAEASGWDGVYLWDHVLYDEPSWSVANPTVAAAAIASATSRIRLIIACALARRRVQIVARETATLDALSDGRLTLVTPIGAMEIEYSGFGEAADLRSRATTLDRQLADLVSLWSGKPTSMAYGLEPVQMLPTPVQSPHIPIWIGGRWPNKAPLRRAARFNGAMPTFVNQSSRVVSVAEVSEVTRYLAAHRVGQTLAGFDLALEGFTEPETAAEVVSAYQGTGLTWWIEAMGWWRGGVAAARKRIAAGIPAAPV